MQHEKRRILIVDDNADIHADFRKVLQPKGSAADPALGDLESRLFGGAAPTKAISLPEYQIDSAQQGEQALEMVESAVKEGFPYSLVFMDVRMPPGWNGIETTKNIWKRFPFTEVVLCTAYSDLSSDDIIQELGVSHRLLFLKKPFDSVSVRQIALAITAKWAFEASSRNQVENLEAAVRERTTALNETVQKLTRTNQELDDSLKRLNEAQALLLQSSKMSALGEMAAGLAHEINNPLAIINTLSGQLCELISDDPVPRDEICGMARSIEETTQRIAKIIQGLRSFSRDGSRDALEPAPLLGIVESTLALCKQRFENHKVQVSVDGLSGDLMTDCRAVQVSQVLLNLLNNAFDAIEPLPERWVRIEASVEPDFVLLSVTDSGKGVPQEVREKMFQPFFTTKPIGKGTGLGLSISKGIMAAHGGDFFIDASSPNTRFVIKLRRAPSSGKAAA